MTRRRRTGRVLLTLDPDTLREDLVETAFRLAHAYEAELVAMFVKASDLINMASLPFPTTVIGPGGRQRTIDTSSLEQRLNQLAQQAEQTVARVAGSAPWSFQVATGHTEQIVSEHAGDFDLLTVCSRTAGRIRTSTAGLPTALLLLGNGVHRNRPVVAVFEGDTGILAAAHRMAQEFKTPLVVMLAAAPDEAARLRRNARAWLSRRHLNARIVEAAPTTLVAAVQGLQPGLVAIARGSQHRAPLHDALDKGANRAPLLELPTGE